MTISCQKDTMTADYVENSNATSASARAQCLLLLSPLWGGGVEGSLTALRPTGKNVAFEE
jgi:hypothetical protein